LRPFARTAKAGAQNLERPMVGIGIVVLFIVVIGALNVFEFGRLD
jgi:hypothetical protein